MPARAQRPCRKPGCPNLTSSAYCTDHVSNNADIQSRRQYDRDRADDPLRKFYKTAQWQRTREAILARDQLCKIAKKCVERYGIPMPSTDVDHVISMRAGGAPYDENNLQGACHECHSWKTAIEDGAFGAK